MSREEADKIAIVLGNAYGPAIEELCCMLNEAGLGFLWTLRGEEPPRFEPPRFGGSALTFAELKPGDVVAIEGA